MMKVGATQDWAKKYVCLVLNNIQARLGPLGAWIVLGSVVYIPLDPPNFSSYPLGHPFADLQKSVLSPCQWKRAFALFLVLQVATRPIT